MSEQQKIWPGRSGSRLEGLIRERLEPGADKTAVDDRIWRMFGETRAVMFTDLVGFSRRVSEFGIVHFLQTIYESHNLVTPCLQEHDGLLLKHEGDSNLIIFPDPRSAVRCAFDLMSAAGRYNIGRSKIDSIWFSIGIGFGEILRIGDSEVYGAEVNAACKLGEDFAKGKEILVTGAVMEALKGDAGIAFERTRRKPPGALSAYAVRERERASRSRKPAKSRRA